MQVVHPICCGIDVHQASVPACLRQVHEDSQVTTEVREFATTYDALLALSDRLTAQQCPVVAMESTGVYTPPKMLPTRYWSGNMALRLCVPACSYAR